MNSEDGLRRRAFQLAYISEELAQASDRLGEQARAIASAAAKLAETSEELVVGSINSRSSAPNASAGATESEPIVPNGLDPVIP